MWSFISRRCCCACGVAFVAIAVVLITTSLVTWYSFFGGLGRVAAEAAKVGRIKVSIILQVTSYQMPIWCTLLNISNFLPVICLQGENFTAADWERTITESGPVDHGWEKEASYVILENWVGLCEHWPMFSVMSWLGTQTKLMTTCWLWEHHQHSCGWPGHFLKGLRSARLKVMKPSPFSGHFVSAIFLSHLC